MPRYPKISDDREIQAHYVACRKAGSDHRLSEMLAFQQAPGASGVDNTFLAGTENGKQFAHAPWLGKAYKEISEKMAPGSTSGAVYKSQIARFAGDPKAWVRSRSDVKKRAAELGKDVEGMVTYHAPAREPKAPVAIAEDIVQTLVRSKVARDPDLASSKKKLTMVRREVMEKHTLPGRRKYIPKD